MVELGRQEDVGRWDVFKSYPRAIYSAHLQNKDTSNYLLQCFRLAVYLLSCGALCFGSLLSRSAVMLLGTNISNITETEISLLTECKANVSDSGIDIGEYVEKKNDVIAAIIISLWMIQTAPDFIEVIGSVWSYFATKRESVPVVKSYVLLETFRSAASLTLVLFIYPQLDLFRCLFVSSSIVFAPILVKKMELFSRIFRNTIGFMERILNVFVCVPMTYLFCVLFSSTYIWSGNLTNGLCLGGSLVFLAFSFWESWISHESKGGGFNSLFEIKYGLLKVNSKTRALTALMRVFVSSVVFQMAVKEHGAQDILVSEFLLQLQFSTQAFAIFWLAFAVIIVNAMLRFSIRLLSAMKMQITAICHPFVLMPVMLFWIVHVGQYQDTKCVFDTLLSDYGLAVRGDRWEGRKFGYLTDFVVGLVWFISYVVWAFSFIEKPKSTKLHEYIEAVAPNSNGLFIDQSILVFSHQIGEKSNPSLYDGAELDEDALLGDYHFKNGAKSENVINNTHDNVPTIYACATMWHETMNEMKQLVESVINLDEQRKLLETRKIGENSKFNLESHIFFDDAWVDNEYCKRVPNEYFEMLYKLLRVLLKWDEAKEKGDDEESDAEEETAHVRILIPTAYGGRFVTKFPNGSVLYVHLKDKQKIRHKKRWSQVMYMYYLLGYRIMASDVSVQDQKTVADNTYILAMDGDSKFKPEAVLRLLNLMRKKSDIGCACGRIHPIGSGIMVWYQKFEYAIAHWFQKAAEHVFGCVLCAPGCFSMFRASALMDDNIMHKYTKVATEARHYVQYDQGEDRWLSTLLLKKGYRIEYVASSDAETYAPEGFEEFFNQRRRWTPSSIANTVDLLVDYKVAVKNNNSISNLYIFYQMIVIGFSMFGPAIIFTMLVFAQTAAFGISSDKMIMWNATPIVAFIACCFLYESSTQLKFAKAASIAYAFVMLSVMVATTSQIVLETIFSPTSMFVVNMVVIFLFAAAIHPKEFTNIMYGSIFFLMIPSTYIFLALYSLINLNVINWGTREAIAKATGNEDKFKSPVNKFLTSCVEKTRLDKFWKWCKSFNGRKNEELEEVRAALKRLEERIEPSNEVIDMDGDHHINDSATESKEADEIEELVYRDDMWMNCENVCECTKGVLEESEETFWNDLIEKYLTPFRTTKQENQEAADALVGLRNKVSFTIIILNGLLVLAVYLLQKHKNVLSMEWVPFKGFEWTKMNDETGQFEATQEALKIDPLGMIIIVFLMGILIVQTLGMIIHRFNTLIESLNEVADLENEFLYQKEQEIDCDEIIEIAQSMLNTIDYTTAHGAGGYRRPTIK
uniref:Chitin synthase n=1 Tax=Rhabditophanes sp. KR3021 TaxID=114890 RepID=A0AC35TMI2_9BILA